MSNPRRLLVLPALSLLTACVATGPDYAPPSIELPERFLESMPEGTAPGVAGETGIETEIATAAPSDAGTGTETDAEPAPATLDGDSTDVSWWQALDDRVLDALVERGLGRNLDLLTAVERVAEARAALRATGAADLIGGTLSASVLRTRDANGATTTLRSGSLDATLGIDWFGGERRSREQARALLEASGYDVGTARLDFLSSLTGYHVDARYYQEALALTRQSADTRRQTLALVTRERRAGTATDLDVLQAQALLDDAEASLPGLESDFHAAVYAIATLLAAPAGEIHALLAEEASQPRPPDSAAVGVPAALLRNRPDVRAAERRFAAAIAAIGVASAALYPSLSLGGSIGLGSAEGWSFGPSLVLPLLNQPRLRAERGAAVSQARQAELAWRDAVRTSVEQVQVAQSTLLRDRREVVARRAAATSYERVQELARATYDAGTTTLLDLLDAERSLATARLSLAAAVRDLASDWSALQIAAGRGWTVD